MLLIDPAAEDPFCAIEVVAWDSAITSRIRERRCFMVSSGSPSVPLRIGGSYGEEKGLYHVEVLLLEREEPIKNSSCRKWFTDEFIKAFPFFNALCGVHNACIGLVMLWDQNQGCYDYPSIPCVVGSSKASCGCLTTPGALIMTVADDQDMYIVIAKKSDMIEWTFTYLVEIYVMSMSQKEVANDLITRMNYPVGHLKRACENKQ